MKLFSNLKKGASEASEKAKVMIEINKLKIQISQNQKEIDEEFKKIGQTVFELFKAEEMTELSVELKDSCNICINKQEKIKELELEIRELNNEKDCPKCGHVVKLDIKFCPSCGHMFEIKEVHTDLEPEETQEEIVKCSKCGIENEEDAKFCCSCGASIEQ